MVAAIYERRGSIPLDPSDLTCARTLDLVPEPATVDLGLPKPDAIPELQIILAETDLDYPNDRRVARRHRLHGTAVRVRIEGSNEARGRVRDISVSGGMFVETRGPFELKQEVRASLSLPTGHTMSFEGRVARSNVEGMGLILDVDDAGSAFLNVFIAVARQSPRTRGLEIVIAKTCDQTPTEVDLSRRWHRASIDLDDDPLHQKFIEACLAAKRLDYALVRYRALIEKRGGDERLEGYVRQIGKILEFSALQKNEEKKRSFRIPAPLVIVALALVSFGGLFLFLSRHS